MTDYADNPTCQRFYIGSLIVVEALSRGGASDGEIQRELADLAREMERSGST